LIGFGMNDGGNSADTEKSLIAKIADSVYGQAPEAEMILLSTMLPNPEAVNGWFGNQHLYEAAFYRLADEYSARGLHCAVAPMTTMSRSVLARKHFRDYCGNNVNHPNDFMVRIYAQTVYTTVTGDFSR
jgi:hypothetical protein